MCLVKQMEVVMTVLSSHKFVQYKPQIANNAVANRKNKLMAKIEEYSGPQIFDFVLS